MLLSTVVFIHIHERANERTNNFTHCLLIPPIRLVLRYIYRSRCMYIFTFHSNLSKNHALVLHNKITYMLLKLTRARFCAVRIPLDLHNNGFFLHVHDFMLLSRIHSTHHTRIYGVARRRHWHCFCYCCCYFCCFISFCFVVSNSRVY